MRKKKSHHIRPWAHIVVSGQHAILWGTARENKAMEKNRPRPGTKWRAYWGEFFRHRAQPIFVSGIIVKNKRNGLVKSHYYVPVSSSMEQIKRQSVWERDIRNVIVYPL